MPKPEIYSDLSPREALDGSHIEHPAMQRVHEIMVARDLLRVIPVVHLGYDMQPDEKGTPIPDSVRLMQGQAIVHRDLTESFSFIFRKWHEDRFLIHRALPGLDANYRSNNDRLCHNNITHVYRLDAYGDWDEDPRTWTARGHLGAMAIDVGPLEAPMLNYDNTFSPARAAGRAPLPDATLNLHRKALETLRNEGFDLGCEWRVATAQDFYADQDPKVADDKHHGQLLSRYMAELELPQEVWGPMPSLNG